MSHESFWQIARYQCKYNPWKLSGLTHGHCLGLALFTFGNEMVSSANVSINSMAAHPPPGRLSGICHFGEKMLQMPHHGVQIMQQNPHPWGLTLIQMPHPWGQNISFLRIFYQKLESTLYLVSIKLYLKSIL